MTARDVDDFSMIELFRLETETQTQILTAGLLALERMPAASDHLEACMRAAHSVKGAARIVGVTAGAEVAHAMEDFFVAAQRGEVALRRSQIDALLRGVDLLSAIAASDEADAGDWQNARRSEIDAFVAALTAAATIEDAHEAAAARPASSSPAEEGDAGAAPRDGGDRVLRVGADSLSRLLRLVGETLTQSRRIAPIVDVLERLKQLNDGTGDRLARLRESLSNALDPAAELALGEMQRDVAEAQALLAHDLDLLQTFERRSAALANRLYDEALACRMLPFANGVRGLPRMVRDLGRDLGKEVALDILGMETQVDRDILEMLDAPLGHLLRNAIDHGIEAPERRRAAGKPPAGTIRLEARHNAGTLQIVLADDGAGVDCHALRETIARRGLADPAAAARMSEEELLEFLFLPGFTMRESVTEISGRGVGLDVVREMIRDVRGLVRVSSRPGEGTRFELQLPVALSILRALLVEIGGEAYAFPLIHIARTMTLPKSAIALLEGRQHFRMDGEQIGLIAAHRILEIGESGLPGDELPVVVISSPRGTYGLAVDRFMGEQPLVVQPLDQRLGKIRDISAAALTEDGVPVLIVDVADMIRSAEMLTSGGRLGQVAAPAAEMQKTRRKRVLVVDDSLTVREIERKLLTQNGYETEIAVDGMDGWNAIRSGHFDLVVTDIDMPRMDGIELVGLIRKDPRLHALPIMIVTYKDREDDRRRGLEAGADYYLTKASFHDEALLQAVVDLIGEARA